MGQAQVTPKTLFLSHFSEIRDKGQNMVWKLRKVSLTPFVQQNDQPSM
jgi:hypothetical protein